MHVADDWVNLTFAGTRLSVNFTWNFNLNFKETILLLQFVSSHRCEVVYTLWFDYWFSYIIHPKLQSGVRQWHKNPSEPHMLKTHVVWLLGNLEWILKPSNLTGFKLWLWTSIGTLILHAECANTFQMYVRQHWPMAPAPKVSSLNWSISSSSSMSPSSSSSSVQSSSRDCEDSGEDRWWDKETWSRRGEKWINVNVDRKGKINIVELLKKKTWFKCSDGLWGID